MPHRHSAQASESYTRFAFNNDPIPLLNDSGGDLAMVAHRHQTVTVMQAQGGGWHDHVVNEGGAISGATEVSFAETTACRATTSARTTLDTLWLFDGNDCDVGTGHTDSEARFLRTPAPGATALGGELHDTAHSHTGAHSHNTAFSTDNHTHQVELTNPVPSTYSTQRHSVSSSGKYMANAGHSHSSATLGVQSHTHYLPDASIGTSEDDAVPPYIDVAVCELPNEGTEWLEGALLLSEGPCPVGWQGDTSAYAGRLLRGASTGSGSRTGGSDTHDHTASHDHSGTTLYLGEATHPAGVTDIMEVHSALGAFAGLNYDWADSGDPNHEDLFMTEVRHQHDVSSEEGHQSSQNEHPITSTTTTGPTGHTPPWQAFQLCRFEGPQPPPECIDDDSGTNDTAASAEPLTAPHSAVVSAASPTDHYRFTLQPGLGLEVTASFSHAEGDVDLILYDASGAIVALSESAGDTETVEWNNLGTTDVEMTLEVVLHNEVGCGSYTLETFSYCANDDAYEPNNLLLWSSDVRSLSVLNAVANDDDWYSVGPNARNAKITYPIGLGDLTLEAWDESSHRVAFTAGANGIAHIFIPYDPFNSTLYVRVMPPGGGVCDGIEYELQVY